MPARALRHHGRINVRDNDRGGKNKNAREGIETTAPVIAGFIDLGHGVEKTKMPARALRLVAVGCGVG